MAVVKSNFTFSCNESWLPTSKQNSNFPTELRLGCWLAGVSNSQLVKVKEHVS